MTSVNLIKFLDRYIGSLICFILSLFNILLNKTGHEYKKILVIQLWGVGETILTLPAIKELRQRFRNSTIDILTTGRVSEAFYNNKNINSTKIVNLNPFSIKLFILKNFRNYDLIIDMEEYLNISSIISFYVGKERVGYSHMMRSKLYTKTVPYNDKQHVSQTYMDLLKPLGIKSKVAQLEKLNYSNEDKSKMDKILKNNYITKKDFIVSFGIGAAESVRERMWPRERYAALADYLIQKFNAKIIFVGNNEEKNLIENAIKLMKNKKYAFNFAGKTTLKEMFYLVSRCKLFVGNDAGPMHVAAAQGVKTIGLFGCNLPMRFGPFGKNNIAIRKQIAKPCINVHRGEVGRCRYGKENACVKKIELKDIIKTVNKVINL